jgi:hypothetical protein
MFKVNDRIRETSTTTGVGTYTLSGPPTGYQPWSSIAANNYAPYYATDGVNWEVGIGQYLATPDRLTRDAILASSNAGAAVNWAAGTRTIRCGVPAVLGLARYKSLAVGGGAGTTVLTQEQQRADLVEYTGALTGARVIEVDATPWGPAVHFNNTSGAFDLTVRVTGQTGVKIPQGKRAVIYCDGTDVRPAVTDFAATQKHTVYIPAGAMVARSTAGAAGPNVVETATNKINIRTLDFDPATQQHAQFQISMPKGWDLGTITAKFIWTASAGTAAQGVVWGIQAQAMRDATPVDSAFGAAQEVTDSLLAVSQVHESADTAAMTVGNTPQARDLVLFQVYRKAADGADTLTGTAFLIGVELTLGFKVADDA